MLQLIEIFRKDGYEITFACAAADSEFSVDLASLNITKKNIELNNSSFDAYLKELQPGIVLFDRFMTEEQFGWRVAEVCPDALRILDTEDLHCLRYGRQSAFKDERVFEMQDLYNDLAKREIASIYRCDLSLIISEYEMLCLKTYFKVDESLLFYLPFLFEPVDTSNWKTFSERRNFISIGNFLHEPNWNSVQFLKEEIWPLIRKELKDSEIHVYGAYPSQKVDNLNNPKEGFIIKGRAESASQVIRNARVLLAPLRFGAGLKGKLADAMMNGTPNVTTPIGAEGMQNNLDWSGIIAGTAKEIAEAAVKLYMDEVLWKRSQKNGEQIINTLFQKDNFAPEFIQRVESLLENIDGHRKANFIGAMLMHHTISGTKYMSKWIEEKNK